MNLYKIRMYLKQNKLIRDLYYSLSGKNREEEKKVDALGNQGMSLVARIDSILDQTDFTYFLTFGNLLGLVRDGRFIAYDNDLDFGICMDDNFSWETLETLLCTNGFHKERQFRLDGAIQEQTYRYGDLTVDFFGYRNEAGESVWHGFFRKDNYIYDNKHDMHVLEARYVPIGEIHRVTFDGVDVPILAEPEPFLESVYTENWRIPDPNWSDQTGPNRVVLDVLGRKELFK